MPIEKYPDAEKGKEMNDRNDLGISGVKFGHAPGKAPRVMAVQEIASAAPKKPVRVITQAEIVASTPGVKPGHAPGKVPKPMETGAQGEALPDKPKRCPFCPSGNLHFVGNKERCNRCRKSPDEAPGVRGTRVKGMDDVDPIADSYDVQPAGQLALAAPQPVTSQVATAKPSPAAPISQDSKVRKP